MLHFHKEGAKIILISCLISVGIIFLAEEFIDIVWLQKIVQIIGLIFLIMILQFFRNPNRDLGPTDNVVVAPVDGKVVVIEEKQEDEYLKSRRKQISIFMSPVNVHVNRMPVGGVVSFFKYHPGKYLVAWHPKSSTENERTTVVVKMGNGVEILFRQIAGALARRIKCYVKTGQPFHQGQEFGFIKFGSRVDIFLPLDAKVAVSIGDITKGGRTIIAELP